MQGQSEYGGVPADSGPDKEDKRRMKEVLEVHHKKKTSKGLSSQVEGGLQSVSCWALTSFTRPCLHLRS